MLQELRFDLLVSFADFADNTSTKPARNASADRGLLERQNIRPFSLDKLKRCFRISTLRRIPATARN